ncbi:diguanylate cyclase [Aliidiomarina halalkaliphila]|uniref:diguanylate cyclase n=1 Tax=Aliidiomarina halalkaliphila TaxID=2593535 RepID=A0A552X070_9GAMM|nr:GGDEF domain-containing protein [Aliidiomarina halalkaliphila]TRW48414.1 diguanylate cyclase [Aliidiomarina halalkaliphila]
MRSATQEAQPLKSNHSMSSCLLWMVFACFVSGLIASPRAYAEQIPEIEQRLDRVDWHNAKPLDSEWLKDAIQEIDPNRAIETYARLVVHHVLDLAMSDPTDESYKNILEQATILAEARDNANAIVDLLTVNAEVHIQREQTIRALPLAARIEELLPQVNSPRVLYHAHHTIARALQFEERFQEALEHLLAAHVHLTEVDMIHTQRRRQNLNIQIARIQLSLGNYSAAIMLLDNTIEDAHTHDLAHRLPELLLIRGYAEQNLHGPSEETVELFLRAAEAAADEGIPRIHMLGYNNAGAALLHLGRYDESAHYLRLGIAVAESVNNVNERSVMEFNLGYIQVLQGDHDEGLAAMQESEATFRSFATPHQIANLLTHLADAYELAGRYQEQAAALKEQSQLRERHFQLERDRVFSELQIQYEAQEKSLQIRLLEQESALQQQDIATRERTQRFMLLVAFLLVCLIVLISLGFLKVRRLNGLLNQANRDLARQSKQDPLTGLWNRRAMNARLSAMSNTNQHYAIFLLDIDHFKHINDTHGHEAGDQVLMEVGERLRRLVRHEDMVVRWGGEEFLLFLPTSNIDGLPALARRVLDSVSLEPIVCDDQRVRVTLSGGYLHTDTPGMERFPPPFEDMIRIADLLLYISKSRGRNQITGLKSLYIKEHVQDKQGYRDLLSSAAADTLPIAGPPAKR